MSASAERRLDPFGLAALVAAGTLAAHQVGYVVDAEARSAHTYLAVAGPAVLLVCFVAAWAAAVRILRRAHGTAPSVAQLTAMQITLYLVIEFAERLTGSSFGSMLSAPVALGLLAQPFVAAAALWLLRVSGQVLLSLAAPEAVPLPVANSFSATPPAVVLTGAPRAAIRLRGPPTA